jgi:hypothetical protein
MELLLNLFWLLIAASALYAWSCRRDGVGSRSHLIALICLLTLLFPVISATDDLHAMRPEIEDAASNRRAFRAGSVDKAASPGAFHHPPALPAVVAAIFPLGVVARVTGLPRLVGHSFGFRFVEKGRGPPFLYVA